MGANSKIEWCDHTFNPWTGCSKVSPGCAHCYAEGWAKRSGLVVWGEQGTRRVTSAANWKEPLKWRVAARQENVNRKVFCASLADVFEDRPELVDPRKRLADMIWETYDWLSWLLLTKRPENISGMMDASVTKKCWMGTTAESQECADRRIPHLFATSARVRFVSYEPALGPVDLGRWIPVITPICRSVPSGWIDWVICGGESGPGARPMHPDWARSVRDQCAAAGVPFFFKQWGEWEPWSPASQAKGIRGLVRYPVKYPAFLTGEDGRANGAPMVNTGKKAAGRLLDGREHNEFPESK